MRVVITGATGNVGSSLVERLVQEPVVRSVVGVSRRCPEWSPPKTTWVEADVACDDLNAIFDGADAVVHLAWLFQPTHRPDITWRANVDGSRRVFEAVASAEVPALVHASSVGAYSPRTSDRLVDESWPTHGWPEAAYSREKSYVERLLDLHEAAHPDRRVVRLRPAFIFQRASSVQQRRLFLGPFFPRRLAKPSMLPVVPDPGGLLLQTLHTDDVVDAYARVVLRPVRGAFNVAAEPVLDVPALASHVHAHVVRMPTRVVRQAVAAAWHAHALPASPQLFDLVMRIPMMSSVRAREELGWEPRRNAFEAIDEFIAGMVSGRGGSTPPLHRDTGGSHRGGEVTSGVGERP